MQVISGHLGWVRCIAVDPSNEWFGTGSGDRTIKVQAPDESSEGGGGGCLSIHEWLHPLSLSGVGVGHWMSGPDQQGRCTNIYDYSFGKQYIMQ